MVKKAICKNCGAMMLLNEPLGEGDDYLDCIAPENFEWTLPAGKITPVVGNPIYVSAIGEHLSREAYLEKYLIDPEVAYTKMRDKIKK